VDIRARSGGIYFFFEDGEHREHSKTLRVVRVGTHAITATSRTTLWNRLRTHGGHLSGPAAGGGNHRGSIFRKRVVEAMLRSGNYPEEIARTWGIGSTAPKAVRLAEHPLEQEVSQFIGRMPFLWINVPDAPSPASDRGYLERNCIGLLSNFEKADINPPAPKWLGVQSGQRTIRESGLWNTNRVEEEYRPEFLVKLESYTLAASR
jgi:hypothetical protein